MPTANQTLQDASLRHAVYLARYRAAVITRMLNLLARADADIVRQLRTRNVQTPFSEDRLQKLLVAVRAQQAKMWVKWREALRGELNAVGVYEADFQRRMIGAALPAEIANAVAVVAPSTKLIHTAVTSRPFQGRFLRDWAASLEKDRLRRVEDAVRIGLVEGETVDKIVSRIAGTRAARYADGVLAINRRNAEAVVRTAVTHTTSRAREALYTANPNLIKGVQYVATLDARTTDICASLDGQVFDVDKGPRPPQHVNCRSTTAPVLASFKELGFNASEVSEGTRASMNGQVPESTTYQSWLKSQPAHVQTEALGATKAKLFRDGGLTVDRLVERRTGHSYTLRELASREAEAFRRAGLRPGDY